MVEKIALMLESDGPGGAESVLFALATGLRERGVEVHAAVLANRQGWLTGRLREAGINLFTPQLAHPLDWHFVRALVEWSRQHQLDLLHGHEFTMGFYAGVAARISGIPHIITMHGGHGYAKALRRRAALGLSARRAATIVGVSESTCQHMAQSLWVPRDRIQLVPNGTRPIRGDRQRTRAELGLSSNEHLFLAVGNLYLVKGHRVLVDACALLAQRTDLPRWKVAIAGRGHEECRLAAQIGAYGLQSKVSLLGLRDDIGDLLAAADGWVMPSLSEGLPLALIEAMFSEVPIVCTAVGGIPDLIRPEESGWLVEPGNPRALAEAMASLLLNPARGARMASRALLVAEQGYGQAIMVDRYLGIYRAALASRTLGSPATRLP